MMTAAFLSAALNATNRAWHATLGRLRLLLHLRRRPRGARALPANGLRLRRRRLAHPLYSHPPSDGRIRREQIQWRPRPPILERSHATSASSAPSASSSCGLQLQQNVFCALYANNARCTESKGAATICSWPTHFFTAASRPASPTSPSYYSASRARSTRPYSTRSPIIPIFYSRPSLFRSLPSPLARSKGDCRPPRGRVHSPLRLSSRSSISPASSPISSRSLLFRSRSAYQHSSPSPAASSAFTTCSTARTISPDSLISFTNYTLHRPASVLLTTLVDYSNACPTIHNVCGGCQLLSLLLLGLFHASFAIEHLALHGVLDRQEQAKHTASGGDAAAPGTTGSLVDAINEVTRLYQLQPPEQPQQQEQESASTPALPPRAAAAAAIVYGSSTSASQSSDRRSFLAARTSQLGSSASWADRQLNTLYDTPSTDDPDVVRGGMRQYAAGAGATAMASETERRSYDHLVVM